MGPISEYLFKNEYKYYDTPDGKDCHKKLWYVTKYAAIYSFIGSSMDIVLYSHPKTYAATLARFGYIMSGIVGMGVTFSSSVCLFTNLRGKDDRINYALAGAATGAFRGAWLKSVKAGSYSAVVLAVAGAVLKDSVINNWQLLISDAGPREVTHTFATISKDFSLMTDPGKTWVTSSEVPKKCN